MQDNQLWSYINALNCQGIGLSEEESAMTIYPNPSGGEVYLSGKQNVKAVYDLNGREVNFEQEGSKVTFSKEMRGLIVLLMENGSRIRIRLQN